MLINGDLSGAVGWKVGDSGIFLKPVKDDLEMLEVVIKRKSGNFGITIGEVTKKEKNLDVSRWENKNFMHISSDILLLDIFSDDYKVFMNESNIDLELIKSMFIKSTKELFTLTNDEHVGDIINAGMGRIKDLFNLN